MDVPSAVAVARGEGRSTLTEVESKAILAQVGVPVVETRLARSKREAVSLARELGFPVALKAVSPDITHKSDVGGVRLGLGSASQVARAYGELVGSVRAACPQARWHGVSVQRMAPPGREVIVGAYRDPQFGPVLMFGLVGVVHLSLIHI